MTRLLDCTLRDGGYVNDWNFGKKEIHDIKENLEKSGVELLEMGFLKDVPYDRNRTLFPGIEWAEEVINPKKENITYCLMVDAPTPFPIEKITNQCKDGIDAIRIIMWKELIKESMEYSRKLIEKGYQVFIQPVRINQYSPIEFQNLIHCFNDTGITAFYIVDSWGTQNSSTILSYMLQAKEYLNKNVSLGYHGHNHMQAGIFLTWGVSRALNRKCELVLIGRNVGFRSLWMMGTWHKL